MAGQGEIQRAGDSPRESHLLLAPSPGRFKGLGIPLWGSQVVWRVSSLHLMGGAYPDACMEPFLLRKEVSGFSVSCGET